MKVVVRSPDVKEVFTADKLSVARQGSDDFPVLVIRDADCTIGEFMTWNHWVLQGHKGDLSEAIADIRNILASENSSLEKLKFIQEAVSKVG